MKPASESSQNFMGKGMKVVTVGAFLWAWLIGWKNIVEFSIQLYLGPNIYCVAPLCVLLLGLVMTNTLGYLEFAQQGRKKEALLAAVDLDGPYTIFQHRTAILADEPCPDWANLRIRQAVWRSVPLAVVSLYLASRVMLEMPVCQIAVSLAVVPIGMEIGDYSHGPVFPIFKDWEVFERIEELRWVYTNQSRDIFRFYEHFRPVEKQAWDVGRCQESNWKPGKSSRSHAILTILPDTPKEGYAPFGAGNLDATAVSIGRVLKESLILKGLPIKEALTQIAELAVQLSKQSATKGKFVGALVASRPWPELVDRIFNVASSYVEQDQKDKKDWTYPRQSRPGWSAEMLKAAVLLVLSSQPLQKATCDARRVLQMSHRFLLALHSLLDLAMLTVALLLGSMAPCARKFGDGVQTTADNLVGLLASYKGALIHMAQLYLHRCWEKPITGGHCLSWYNSIMLGTAAPIDKLGKAVATNFEAALKPLEFSWKEVVLMGLSFVAFCWLCKRSAAALLPMLPGQALVNVGIAGPFYLLSLVPETLVKTVLNGIPTLVVLRELSLTCMLAAAWWGVRPEPFMALMLNREIGSMSLLLFWFGLCFAHLISAFFCVDALWVAHRHARQADSRALPDEEKAAVPTKPAPGDASKSKDLRGSRRLSRTPPAPPPVRRPSQLYGSVP